MNKYIIIGSTGIIGRAIANVLSDNNKVIALGRNIEKLSSYFKNDVIKMTYSDFYKLDDDYSDYTAINLAYARNNDYDSIKSSIDFTYEITQKLINSNIGKYIYISSQSIYDEKRKFKAKENDLYFPKNLYGLGKIYLENWLQKCFNINNIQNNLIIIRLGSVVGEGFEKRITSRMVHSALTNKKITVFDSGQQFSFIEKDDIANAIISMCELNVYEHNVYNVGSDEIYSLINIAEEIKKHLYNKNIDVDVEILKKGSYTNNTINIDRFKSETLFQQQFGLSEIIEREIKRSK